MSTRIRTDRFGDTWTVNTGPEARRIRREIEAKRDAALARYDANPTMANLKAFERVADVEAAIRDVIEQGRKDLAA